MRLYSKAYAGKQVNWRDSNGDTWVLYPDPITGEVFYIASTGQSVDGYDTPFKVVTVQGVDGQPDTMFADFGPDFKAGLRYPEAVVTEDNLVPMGFVYGATAVRDFFELPAHVALELLADSGVGVNFVDWRPVPAAPKRKRKVSS